MLEVRKELVWALCVVACAGSGNDPGRTTDAATGGATASSGGGAANGGRPGDGGGAAGGAGGLAPGGSTSGGAPSGGRASGGTTAGGGTNSSGGNLPGSGGVPPLVDGGGPVCGPVALHLVLDDSGSMIPFWNAVTSDIGTYVEDPWDLGQSVGLEVAGSQCDPGARVNATVAIASLPGNADAIRSALPVIPIGGGPIASALRAAIGHAREFQQRTGVRSAVALVTDGPPTDTCSQTPTDVLDAASEGNTGSPPVRTFVVASGTSLADAGALGFLEDLAAAGGTEADFSGVLPALRAAREATSCR